MARFTQSAAFTPSNTDDGSAARYSATAKAFGDFSNTMLNKYAENTVRDAKKDAQNVDFKNPTLVDNNTIYGNTFDEIVLKGHQADVRMSMTNKLNELMVANKDNPLAFKASADEIRKEMMKEVHPNVKGATEIYFNSQIEQGFGKLRTNQMIVEKGVAEGKMNQEIQDLAAKANLDAREGADDSINASNLNAISAAIYNAPHLNENQKETALRSAIIGVVNNVHLFDINAKGTSEAKYAYLDGIKDDVPETHTVEEWDNFVAQARARIARDDAIAEGQKVKATAENNRLFSDLAKGKLNSLSIDPEEEQKVRANLTPEQQIELDKIESAMEFGLKPFVEQQAVLQQIDGGVNPEDIDKALLIKEVISKSMIAAKKDYIAYAQATGVTEQTTLPRTAEELAARNVESKRLAVRYNQPPRFFSESEVSQVQGILEQATVPEQAQFISSVADMPHALDQIAEKGDPIWSVLAHVNENDLTQHALIGQKLVKDKVVSADADSTKDWWAVESLGIYDDPLINDANYKTVSAVYAYKKSISGTDDPDSELYDEAIKEVTGGFLSTEPQTNSFFNFFGPENKTVIELPRGVDGDEMTLYMDGFSTEMVGTLGAGVKGLSDEASARQIRESRWKNSGSGEYHVIHPRYGMLLGANGKPLIIPYSPEAAERRNPITYDEKYAAIIKKAQARPNNFIRPREE